MKRAFLANSIATCLLILLAFYSCTTPPDNGYNLIRNLSSSPNIRVLVKQMKPGDIISFDVTGAVTIQSAGTIKTFRSKGTLQARCGRDNMTMDSLNFAYPATIRGLDDYLGLNGKYDGYFVIDSYNGQILVINYVNLESYLESVVFHEIGGRASPETIKAQAICARSYVYASLSHNKKQAPYDFYSDERNQVYSGFSKIPQNVVKSVRETFGEILTENGKVLYTFYSSTCGGRTMPAENLFKNTHDFKSLKGIKCDYCKNSPHYEWLTKIPRAELAVKVGAFTDIRLTKFANSDSHTENIVLRNGSNEITVDLFWKFRTLAGRELVKSPMLLEVTQDKDFVYFKGRGFGHCVGMCQWGAIEMGARGRTYREILRYYFPGSQIEKIY